MTKYLSAFAARAGLLFTCMLLPLPRPCDYSSDSSPSSLLILFPLHEEHTNNTIHIHPHIHPHIITRATATPVIPTTRTATAVLRPLVIHLPLSLDHDRNTNALLESHLQTVFLPITLDRNQDTREPPTTSPWPTHSPPITSTTSAEPTAIMSVPSQTETLSFSRKTLRLSSWTWIRVETGASYSRRAEASTRASP